MAASDPNVRACAADVRSPEKPQIAQITADPHRYDYLRLSA
jgi:hypothetical protein